MKNFSRYTITAALPYANGPLHIGHIAGAYLPADTYVRYLRAKRKDVAFICGSDEHGAAITLRAKKEGITPQQIIDKYHHQIKTTFEQFGIAFDIYHRTSSPIHHQTSQDFFLQLNKTGKFKLIENEQFYDTEAKQFLADRYIMGTCPKCGHDAAYGDQCEKCGATLSPTELINPKSTLSGSTPILKNTTHWYLPLNEYEAWLREWLLEGKKDVLKANVFGQCRSWLEQGLQPRAMTRDLDWGVKVPLPEAEGKVLYVWLDAPIGYISATKAWAEQTGKNWEDYWKKDDTRLIHFIGKDNIVFHCIIFPIMLKAHGEFVLPDNIPANEFLNLEGDKISTSRNWAVWLHEYLEDFPNQQDTLRYVLTSIAPETKDSEFTWKDFQARHNSELADILGNFVNRVIVLTNKYFGGAVPALGELSEYDKEVLAEIATYPQKIEALLENFKFRDAQTELMNLARLGNKYFTVTEPWKLAGKPENLELVGTVLNVTLQIAANLAILAQPFLPFTAEKIQKLLGNGAVDTTLAAHVPQDTNLFVWENAGKTDILKSYHKIAEKPEVLFPKIEDATIAKQLAKLEASKLARKPAEPLKENMSYDDFTKLDLRIATITAAEKVAKAKKLLKLTLDTGLDIRTVVSGIAEYYEPEKIIGQQVVLLANLAPKEIKGILSQGMILMAEDKDGSLKFVQPSAVLGNGCTVR